MMISTGAILNVIHYRIKELKEQKEQSKRQEAWVTVIGVEQGIFELERLKGIIQKEERVK